MPLTSTKLGGHIALGMSCSSVPHPFETSHIFGTMYARILKFHICIVHEKLAIRHVFFSFLSVRFFLMKLGILINENLVSKISKEPLKLGS